MYANRLPNDTLFRRLLTQGRRSWPHFGARLAPHPLKTAVDCPAGSGPEPGFLDTVNPLALPAVGGP